MSINLDLDYTDHNGVRVNVLLDRFPDECPSCKKGVEAEFLGAYGEATSKISIVIHFVQVVFRCRRQACQAVFIGYYASKPSDYFPARNVFLNDTGIFTHKSLDKFDTEIEEVSPDFVKIYNQAKIANDIGLDEICGPGYRKALEFLIKDFLCVSKPHEVDEIKKGKLGWLIANKVEDPKIQTTAGLAKDKGNDETHYEKRIEDISLEDMKKLIKLTVFWISSELLTSNYAKKKEK